MSAYSGLANDVTYIDYIRVRDNIVRMLNDDEGILDMTYIKVMLLKLQNDRDNLKKLKESSDGNE